MATHKKVDIDLLEYGDRKMLEKHFNRSRTTIWRWINNQQVPHKYINELLSLVQGGWY